MRTVPISEVILWFDPPNFYFSEYKPSTNLMAENQISIRVIGTPGSIFGSLVEPDDDVYFSGGTSDNVYIEGETSKEFADGPELVYEEIVCQQDLFESVAEFTLQTAQDVSIELIADYIYNRLSGSEIKLEIGAKEVPIDADEVQSSLDELIE